MTTTIRKNQSIWNLSILSFLLGLLSANLWAGVELPKGTYHQTTTDMSVQTQAGPIAIKRTWNDNQWHINRAWNNLLLEYDYLDGSVKRLQRNDDIYERVGKSSLYRFDEQKTLSKTATGFRWQNPTGDWIDYDEQGVLLSYGYKSITKATMVRNSDGLIEQVKDTRDRVIYTFHYTGKTLQSISDNSVPARSVTYHYTGEKLTKVTDVLGHDHLFGYTGSGDKLRMSHYTNANGHKTTIQYNTTGDVASVLDEQLIGYRYGYDYDKVKKEHYTIVRHTSGRVTETWYDQLGHVLRTDINGETTLRVLRDSNPTGFARRDTRTNRRGLKTINDYDAQDNLLQQTLADGSVLSYQYDSQYANLIEQKDELGYITKNTYTSDGYLETQTEAHGTPLARTTTYTHNIWGQQTRVATASDSQSDATLTQYDYDTHGNLSTVTDAMGRVTTYTHDNMGNVLTHTQSGQTTTYVYNAAGWLTEQRDPLNRKTQYDYDKLGNLIETRQYLSDDTLHSTETRTYTYRSELHRVTDDLGNVTQYVYDTRGNLLETQDAAQHSQFYDYDLNNRRIKHRDTAGNETRWVYGPADTIDSGLLTQVIYPTYTEKLSYNTRGWVVEKSQVNTGAATQTTQYSYDRSGNLIAQTDAKNRVTRYEYDALHRQARITDPSLGVTQYGYDNRDNILQVIDANGHTIRTYSYDKTDLNLTESKPEGQSDTHTYNTRGLLETSKDGEGQRSHYSYNEAEQLIKIERFAKSNSGTTADKTITFTYNTLGLLEGYNDGQSSGAYEYDSQQRKTKETVTYRLGQADSFSKSHEYTYDKRGNKKSFTDPQGTEIQYFYNDNNQLNALIIPTVGTLSFEYQWQAPKLINLPGGHRIEYQYDGLLRPKQIAAIDSGDNPIHRLDYEYDVVNNITQKQLYRGVLEANGVVDYDYNALDRLTGVDYSANINGDVSYPQGDEHFSYDPVGNRLSDDKTTSNWSYNDNNELQSFDTTSFKYNLNGQMTEKTVNGQKTTYTYNLDNRLSEIKDNSNQVIAQYQYDPFGRRLSKTLPQESKTIYFYYSDEGLVGEYEQSGQLIQSYGYKPDSYFTSAPIFSHRPDFIEAKGHVYYVNDHIGTPQKLITNTGRKVWESSEDGFGKTIVLNNEFRNPLRFPGQYKDDESNLRYNYKRYYDPSLGRYVTSDPIGLEGGLNTYGYVGGDPLNKIDPLGLWNPIYAGGRVSWGVGQAIGTRIATSPWGRRAIAWGVDTAWDIMHDDAANDPIYDVDKEKVAICLLECDLEALEGAEDCVMNECLDDKQYQECLNFVENRRDNCYKRCTAGR